MRRTTILTVALLLAFATPAEAAQLRPYARGVTAIASGGHRVVLRRADYDAAVPPRVLDERTGALAAVPTPPAGCLPDPIAIGGAAAAFPWCRETTLVSLADGRASTYPMTDRVFSGGTITAIGRRWFLLYTNVPHVRTNVAVDRATGEMLVVSRQEDGEDDERWQTLLSPRTALDLDAPEGMRTLCAPLRRHRDHAPGDFLADGHGSAWVSEHGTWLQRCGAPPLRLSRVRSSGLHLTRRVVAWVDDDARGRGRVHAVNRRTGRARSWPIARFGDLAAVSHDHVWVNDDHRLLAGDLP